MDNLKRNDKFLQYCHPELLQKASFSLEVCLAVMMFFMFIVGVYSPIHCYWLIMPKSTFSCKSTIF